MKTIGFSGVYYTLWDVTAERVDVATGAWYNKVRCIYYQNLSKNLDEAINKAGTNNVDEHLRGKRKSFEYNTNITVKPELMTECESLFWVIFKNDEQNLISGVRETAFNRALELGYLVEVVGEFVKTDFSTYEVFKTNVAYRWNHKCRFEDEWHSRTLNKMFIGII